MRSYNLQKVKVNPVSYLPFCFEFFMLEFLIHVQYKVTAVPTDAYSCPLYVGQEYGTLTNKKIKKV